MPITGSAVTLSLGTATPGGGFPLYGDAFAEVMNAADPGLQLRTQNTKGSTENIPLLEDGKLDLALVAGEPAYEAFKGIKRPPTRLKILTALYSNPGMFVVRADSPYRTIRDLVGSLGSVGMWSVVVILPAVQADFAATRGAASLAFTFTMVGFGIGGRGGR